MLFSLRRCPYLCQVRRIVIAGRNNSLRFLLAKNGTLKSSGSVYQPVGHDLLVERKALKTSFSFKYLGSRFVSSFYFKNTLLAKEECSLFVVVRPRGFFLVAVAELRIATVSFVRPSRTQALLFEKMFRITFVFRSVRKIAKSDC